MPIDPEDDSWPSELSEHAFVVRVWTEARELPNCAPEWRGHATHVQNGHHLYFRTLSALVAFIQQEVGWQG
jgi:hypothetical protein